MGKGKFMKSLMVLILLLASHVVGAQNNSEIKGRIHVLVADDFENKKSQVLYMVEDIKTKRFYKINFTDQIPAHVKTGDIIRARGLIKNNSIELSAANGSFVVEEEVSLPLVEKAAQTYKVLVIRTNFTDAVNPCSQSTLEKVMFPSGSGNSISELYDGITHGAFALSGQVTPNVDIGYSSTGTCDYSGFLNAARSEASKLGYDIYSYDHLIYHLPPIKNCNWWGLGSINGKNIWVNGRCTEGDIYAHELGHNYGMRHSGSGTSVYADLSDIMGFSGVGLREVNSAHRVQKNWISSGKVITSLESGQMELAPLNLTGEETDLAQVIQVLNPQDSSEYYYFSYRQPIKYDATLSSINSGQYIKGLAIHTSRDGGATTKHIKTLIDGESFMLGSDTLITQISHDSNSVAFKVETDQPCYRSSPSVSISPVTQSASSGESKTYTLVIKNNDSGSCNGSDFSLGYSSSSVDLLSALPSSVLLDNGQSFNLSFDVASSLSASNGVYSFSISATHGNTGVQVNDSANLSVENCIKASPIVSITPKLQSVSAGANVTAKLLFKNNNSSACARAQFNLDLYSDPGLVRISSLTTSLALDSGASYEQTVEFTTRSDMNGIYHFTFSAIDSLDGQYFAEEIGEVDLIQVGLEAPNNLTASSGRKGISLSWTGTSNAFVYEVYRNGSLLARPGDTSYQDRNVSSGQTYIYYVLAVDSYGNKSSSSNTVEITFSSSGGGGGKGGGKGGGGKGKR